MNLRNIGRDGVQYNIGLDLGTNSVGWAVTDSDGRLLQFKGKPTWGSRLFPAANPASDARAFRGQRRRYNRRRQRLNLLQELFCEHMQAVDGEFFVRLNQSRLLKEDRVSDHSDYRFPLFNNPGFTDVEYYRRFPTIYHLRRYLMECDKKEDLRLVYLALHNIVKSRGNFLWQDNTGLSASNANADLALERMCAAIKDWCVEHDILGMGEPDCQKLRVLLSQSISKRSKQECFQSALNLSSANRRMAKALSCAVFGYVVEFGDVFGEAEKKEGSKFTLDDDAKVEEYRSLCPDDGMELFESLLMMRSAVILMDILDGGDGRTISYHKCDEYDRYAKDLKMLKTLVRQYVPQKYDEVFRGEHYSDLRWSKDYDPEKAKGYTKYNLSHGQAYDVFKKYIERLFENTDAPDDERYKEMMSAFGEERFLRRLKTSDNGSIPYQLHLEEMRTILSKQGEFYPFLLEERDKLESLVTFRIPYYVGPLTQKNASTDSTGKTRFAWSERVEGEAGSQPIKPWNWDQIIDKDKSAEAFIRRMTGTCTYLYGESVLPKASLLYERFCVLNELNGARYCIDGDKWHRFSHLDRIAIVEELFERGRVVSYNAVENWMQKRHPGLNPHVCGGQGETGFESKLSSYGFFRKLLGVDEISGNTADMVENIILWNTLFEDRDILKGRIARVYGARGSGTLSGEQIGKICKKRFTGWGRLSKRLLCETRIKFDGRRLSIMDVMSEGMPYGRYPGAAMVFMEILRDSELGFQDRIDEINKTSTNDGLSIEDLPGSPALRRSVNQAMRIVAEIVSIAGSVPSNIYIETTREDDEKKKGKRTARRYNQIEAALKAFGEEGNLDPQLLAEFKGKRNSDINDRLALYFLQNGKCMYSGSALDIKQLSMYQIDHVIPQSYIKDDSMENKVLVLPSTNQSKSDSLLIDSSVRQKMAPMWRELHCAGMIGDKKFRNLMRSEISNKQMRGFIARQLVETSQTVKYVRAMLEEKYQGTCVRSIKASLSHQLRASEEYVKCREANGYHHAHDALLACELGRFIQLRYGDMFDNPVGMEHAMRAYIKSLSDERGRSGRMPGSTGMVVATFSRDYADRDTGEVLWEGSKEAARIRRYLDYKDCHISRMPEITSGAFWKQNALSPKVNRPPVLALKGNLDPGKYGGYTGEQFSNFLVARGKKRGKATLQFVEMPITVAAQIKEGDTHAVGEYAKKALGKKGVEFVGIERVCVPKYQLVEIDGERFYITGKKEMRNGRQLAFSQKDTKLLALMVAGTKSDALQDSKQRLQDIGDAELVRFYDCLLEKCDCFAKRLSRQMRLESLRDGFIAADVETKARTILAIVCICNAENNAADLTGIGGVKLAGRLQPTYDKELNVGNGHFVFVDQSVTGMFERRWKIGI